MRIAYCIPGTGGAFYCENCIRDCALIAGLRGLGHEVIVIPLYLPLNHEEGLGEIVTPIAFGAVRLYLEHRFPLLRALPAGVLALLDTIPMLKLAASMAGSTRAAGNEELTLAMLNGESGAVSREFIRFASWLTTEIKPDALFVSNAFLLGITSAVKAVSDLTTVCMVQDEHTWVDSSNTALQQRIWQKIAAKSSSADLLISLSSWYAVKLGGLLGLPDGRITVIPFGVDPSRYATATGDTTPLRIGFLGRLDRDGGVGTLIDAYCQLPDNGLPIALSLCGGYTRDDQAFLDEKLAAARSRGSVTVYPDFSFATRSAFLSSLSVLAVPVHAQIALGVFIFEAWAAGVPVVQPDQGGFSEIVGRTGGGLLYSPNTPQALAQTLAPLLSDNRKRNTLAARGLAAVNAEYNNLAMARAVLALIEKNSR
jgi:glycosyltransferase involved in cell wall biosynthesis